MSSTSPANIPSPEALTVDGLAFELRRSDARKTLGITVERDGSLVISAPADCPPDFIEKTVRKKLM